MNQDTSQVKKTKDQMRMEKKKNASIVPLSKQTRTSLNIMGVQPEDHIFHLRNALYLKIYSLDNATLTEDEKIAFIRAVGQGIDLRIRLTSVHKLRGEKYNKLLFLSVFVEAINYTEANMQYQKFDEDIKKINLANFGVSLAPCSINYAMMYVVMNFNGQLKMYDIQSSLKKHEDWKNTVFPDLKGMDRFGYQDNKIGKYGVCYAGTEFPLQIEGLYEEICSLGIEFKSCLDFQPMNEKEIKMYQKRLEQKYNYRFSEENNELLICATFLFSFSADSYEKLLDMKGKIVPVFEKYSLVVSPCPAQQQEAYYSLGSLGITEYHVMRNVSLNVISKLPV